MSSHSSDSEYEYDNIDEDHDANAFLHVPAALDIPQAGPVLALTESASAEQSVRATVTVDEDGNALSAPARARDEAQDALFLAWFDELLEDEPEASDDGAAEQQAMDELSVHLRRLLPSTTTNIALQLSGDAHVTLHNVPQSLVERCALFASALHGDWAETATRRIVLPRDLGFCVGFVAALLWALDRDNDCSLVIRPEIVVRSLYASHYLGLTAMYERVVEALDDSLCVDNCCFLLTCASELPAQRLRARAYALVVANVATLSGTPDFEEIPTSARVEMLLFQRISENTPKIFGNSTTFSHCDDDTLSVHEALAILREAHRDQAEDLREARERVHGDPVVSQWVRERERFLNRLRLFIDEHEALLLSIAQEKEQATEEASTDNGRETEGREKEPVSWLTRRRPPPTFELRRQISVEAQKWRSEHTGLDVVGTVDTTTDSTGPSSVSSDENARRIRSLIANEEYARAADTVAQCASTLTSSDCDRLLKSSLSQGGPRALPTVTALLRVRAQPHVAMEAARACDRADGAASTSPCVAMVARALLLLNKQPQ